MFLGQTLSLFLDQVGDDVAGHFLDVEAVGGEVATEAHAANGPPFRRWRHVNNTATRVESLTLMLSKIGMSKYEMTKGPIRFPFLGDHRQEFIVQFRLAEFDLDPILVNLVDLDGIGHGVEKADVVLLRTASKSVSAPSRKVNLNA